MTGPAGFAKARLAEDEAAAERAANWYAQHERSMPEAEMRQCIELASRRERNYDQPWWAANMRYQLDSRHLPSDPERVLREVEAGRRILARHWNCGTGGGWCDGVGLPVDAPCPDMADLLVRWAGDPGYDQKWKPAGEGSADG